jgi:hypothetical protein
MAFVFTIDLDQPITTQIFRESDRAIVTIVGMDDDCPLSYALVIGISAGAGFDEYYFKLVEVDAESGEEREHWDGRAVGEFIGDEDRGKILQVLLRVTKLLVTSERPDCFYYCTHGDNMPPESLEKYEAINQILTECGYVVSLTSRCRGRFSWWAERAD